MVVSLLARKLGHPAYKYVGVVNRYDVANNVIPSFLKHDQLSTLLNRPLTITLRTLAYISVSPNVALAIAVNVSPRWLS